MKKLLLVTACLIASFSAFSQSKKELLKETASLKDSVMYYKQALSIEQSKSADLSNKLRSIQEVVCSLNLDGNSSTYTQGASVGSGNIINTGKSEQCRATTNAGSQCSRSAESGSIYCWQHKSSNKEVKSATPSSSGGRTYITGPRGGQYYINSKGNKTYRKR